MSKLLCEQSKSMTFYLFGRVFKDLIEVWLSFTHLVLVSSEALDLISAVQIPQSDCEIVG